MLLEVMVCMFTILTVVILFMSVYLTYKIVHLKYVGFIVCQFYLNKVL